MKKKFTRLMAVFALLTFLAAPMGMRGQASIYEQLTSIANIDEDAQYVLGIDGTGFHYSGTSDWGKTALPSAQTPIYYTLTKASDGNSFTAQATIGGTTYYLQIPTSNTFSMATSAGTNTDIIIGTTQVSGTNYAVANKTTTARHLRINGTSGLRSYAGTTGNMAFFYKVVTGTSHTVTYYANVDGINPIEESYLEGATVTVAANTFVNPGYAFTEWNTETDGTGDSYAPGDEIENIQADIDLYAQWEESTEMIDLLNRDFTGVSSNSYTTWSGKKGASGAIYAGNSAGGNNSIQLRSSSNSGIISTTSAGIVTHIDIDWNSNTANSRTLNIYGKNSAYEAVSDLYDNSAQGTLLGSIVKGTTTSLEIQGDYTYIGLRSNDGAMYLNSVSITWEPAPSVASPSFSPAGGTYGSAQSVTITCETEGATIYYTTDGTTPTSESTPYTGAINVTETTTIKAIAYVGNEASSVASATYTFLTPLTTMQDIFTAATSTSTQVAITFDNYIITGKSSGSNSNKAYLTDGTKGCIIYESGHGFTAGDVLNGTAVCNLVLFGNAAELTGLTHNTYGLTVTTGGSVTPVVTTVDMLTAVNTGSVVTLNGLSYDGTTTLKDSNNNPVVLSNTIYTASLTSGKTYNITGVFEVNYGNKRINPRSVTDIVEATNPTISIDPATANPFTYVLDNGPSEDQTFEVTGTNLSSDDIVATITTGAEYFEITDDETYSSTVTVNSGGIISIRLKAGLALGNYAGALTLTNEGAENVVVALSGSVTGQTYSIELDDQVENGTITADMASAPAGATVTLTATPDAGYELGEWTVLDGEANEITVINNQFEMPASDVLVSATFNAKPTYAITTVVTPTDGGTVVTLDNAYEGQNVEVEVEAATGFTFSSLVVSKTDDATTTVETTGSLADGFNFTMPNYAVTVTATFISDTYTGSFVLFTGEITEGDYVLVYEGQAMTNTVTSNKFDVTDVIPSGSIITDPSRNIVWHIAQSATIGYWTIKNEKVNKYANSSSGSGTNVSLVDTPYDGAKWIASGTDTHDFRPKINEGQSTVRYLRKDARFGAYASTIGGSLTLYKYTVLTELTITFNGNGGTYTEGDTYTQTVYDGIAANLDANKFTKTNSVFVGWSTTQNGEVEYADEASITVNGDITLYAQWETGYTAMVDDEIDGGSVYIVTATGNEEIIEAAAGTEITLTYTADLGYAFSAWNVYYTDENEQVVPVEVNDDKFTMPAYDVTISAGFEKVTTYSLVTNIDQIVSGKHYIIASGTDGSVKVMAGQNDNNRATVAVTAANNTIPETAGIYEFVINGLVINETNYFTIYDTNNASTGYLYASGGTSSNQLKTQATNNNKGQWSITINSESSVASITANFTGNNARNLMRYNSNNNIFSCYNSGQQSIYLFIKDGDTDFEYYGSELSYSEDEIPVGQTITVGTGSVMTINNGSFTNTDPEKLIIEDGGQLIHDNAVSATIQKNVTGYSNSKDKDNNGYLLIASPVESDLNVATHTNLTEGDYDLYYFDQSQAQEEWRNYKNAANSFTSIENGKGYLYANTQDITIEFSGELKPSLNDVQVVLNYVDEKPFSGWNLVGNPFACNAYVKDTLNKGLAFYKMNGNGNGFVAVLNGSIAPMEGVFVHAAAADQSFGFTRTAPDADPGKGNLNIQVAQVTNTRDAQSAEDNAIVRFDGGNTLEKFSFREDNAKLYIPQNGKDYAVVSADAQGEMPVNFKATEDGTYTIDFSMDNVEFGYLHLIDNKTGNDVDLLQTPSYTFEANTIDYASRFRLVFRAIGNENDSENNDFGFIDANGNLLILGIDGTATLQVIDITGRTVSNETFSGNYSKAINAKAGVYMLRLIQGNDVKTQKIVVR